MNEAVFPGTIETDRLVLRGYARADVPDILELIEKNRDRLVRDFSQMAKGITKTEDAIAFGEEKADQWSTRKAFCYGIWLKASKELMGQLQVKNVIWEVPSAELSYFISASSQRQGHASEAISAVLRVGFEELSFKRLFVRVIRSNQESISLAKKLGFQYEGLHRNEFRCGFGELHDVHYFSRTF